MLMEKVPGSDKRNVELISLFERVLCSKLGSLGPSNRSALGANKCVAETPILKPV